MHFLDKVQNPGSCGVNIQFTKAETAINNYISQNLEQLPSLTICDLAENTYSSRATIDRYLKKIGADGFKQFKTSLILELEQTNINHYPSKSDFLSTSKYLLNDIDKVEIGDFIENLYKYKNEQIITVGMGSSYISAQYFARRLTEFGFNIRAIAVGEHMGLNLFAKAAIYMSATGENPFMLQMLEDVKAENFAITKADSRLAKLAEHNLTYHFFTSESKNEQFENQYAVIMFIEKICFELKKKF